MTAIKESDIESEYGFKDDFSFEVGNEHVTERAAGLTPMGFDNEIGLWEELESREQKKKYLSKYPDDFVIEQELTFHRIIQPMILHNVLSK